MPVTGMWPLTAACASAMLVSLPSLLFTVRNQSLLCRPGADEDWGRRLWPSGRGGRAQRWVLPPGRERQRSPAPSEPFTLNLHRRKRVPHVPMQLVPQLADPAPRPGGSRQCTSLLGTLPRFPGPRSPAAWWCHQLLPRRTPPRKASSCCWTSLGSFAVQGPDCPWSCVPGPELSGLQTATLE